MKKNLYILKNKLKINFTNENLLEKALTHKSYNLYENYEKLEFLGDRVLGLVLSKKLLELYPNEKEGILDKKLASLVNKNKCYEVGKKLNLEKFILYGKTKKKSINFEKKIVSDSIEALIGAIYIDSGIDVVEKFILKNWKKHISMSTELKIDAKTRLQEYSLKNYKVLPMYKVISNTGPRHSPTFKVAVKLKDTKFVEGSGSSKKNAEQVAANNFLEKINNEMAR
tara:strand:- start:329 stop:1006 length:678 start_codon:yes stop_codon:yes gene_type:complete